MLSQKNKGFNYELTEKQKFYLYLYSVCPAIVILDILWKHYITDRDISNRNYHIKISPFKPQPCGYNLLKCSSGYIDPDMFIDYYQPREHYLTSIKIIGHPYFLCKVNKTKEELEQSVHYFTALINEPQIKVTISQKIKILSMAIQYLSERRYQLKQDQIMRYIFSCFTMYNNHRILFAYPIAIDSNGILCRFE